MTYILVVINLFINIRKLRTTHKNTFDLNYFICVNKWLLYWHSMIKGFAIERFSFLLFPMIRGIFQFKSKVKFTCQSTCHWTRFNYILLMTARFLYVNLNKINFQYLEIYHFSPRKLIAWDKLLKSNFKWKQIYSSTFFHKEFKYINYLHIWLKYM